MKTIPWSRRPTLGSALALGALLAAGCSPSTGQVEAGLERELPRLFGPAQDYDVTIDGLRAGDGEADRVRATGLRVQPEGVPVVDRIDVDMRGVKYDRDRKRLERIDSVRATATILATDLAYFLESHDNVRSARVTLEAPDLAVIHIRPDLSGFTLPPGVTVEVRGRIEGEGPHLRFVVSDASAGGFGLGEGGADRLSRLINPLVDLTELPIPMDVTDVRVEGSVIHLNAVGGTAVIR